MRHRMTKACSIPPAAKAEVWERDGGRCILCGSPDAAPNAHFIPRSHGGLGTPENVVTLCMACHTAYDNSGARRALQAEIRAYLMERYPGWDETKLIYRKWNYVE